MMALKQKEFDLGTKNFPSNYRMLKMHPLHTYLHTYSFTLTEKHMKVQLKKKLAIVIFLIGT